MKLALIMVLLTAYWPAFAQIETEVAYDDGNPNHELQFTRDGVRFVTRFTPPAPHTQITKARYFIADTSEGASFDLTVFRDVSDEPAVILYGPVHITVEQLAWNEWDLTTSLVYTDDDFYISLSYDGVSKPMIGAEDRSPTGRAYETDG